jgi:hypothetical protein
MSRRIPRAGLAAVVLLALSPERRAAADVSTQDQAVAQSLYDEAKKLVAAGKVADACPKFEESQRLDPTPVTEFYLADCYDRTGRTASAWTTFLDLAASEHKIGGRKSVERERVARERARALESKLSQLVIEVPSAARVTGLAVTRDGTAVREGQWGAPVAVDPGKHTIEASAPGKKAWSTTQEVHGTGTTTVRVEALADVPAPEVVPPPHPSTPEPSPPPPEQSSASPLKTVGLVAGGVGVAGLIAGGVLGALALSKNSAANSGHCGGALGGPNQCDAQGVSLRSDAVTFGNYSTISLIAGGVLAAGGATMWLLAPSASVQIAPAVGTNGAGIAALGRF